MEANRCPVTLYKAIEVGQLSALIIGIRSQLLITSVPVGELEELLSC